MFVVAIDGPAGSGKTTTARIVAARLGMRHLDTGAMYRALTWLALHKQVNLDDPAALGELAEKSLIDFTPAPEGEQLVYIDDQEVTVVIRSPDVNANVSKVSAVAAVRSALVKRQRELAESQSGVVMEGRDIGTVVFPNAELKIFLVATLEERGRRQMDDFAERGLVRSYQEHIEQIRERDELDTKREASPLLQADDAIEVDTTGMTIDEQVQAVIKLIEERRS